MWCQPRGTMHHVNSEEVNDMWQFEQQRALKSRVNRTFYRMIVSERLELIFSLR